MTTAVFLGNYCLYEIIDLQVSNLASQAKRERNVLTKEVSKISNHGIAV